jgi:hypothetical protein
MTFLQRYAHYVFSDLTGFQNLSGLPYHRFFYSKEFFANIDNKINPKDPVLILFEDSDVRRISAFIQSNAHLLSTRGLLVGMEECHLLESAEAIWQSIINGGRMPSTRVHSNFQVTLQ